MDFSRGLGIDHPARSCKRLAAAVGQIHPVAATTVPLENRSFLAGYWISLFLLELRSGEKGLTESPNVKGIVLKGSGANLRLLGLTPSTLTPSIDLFQTPFK